MHRRHFISSTAATAGALLLGNALGPATSRSFAATGSALGPADHWGTPRASKLRRGVALAHGDMHNHTLFSDGDGNAEQAFELMRERNLDVACITDHTSGAKLVNAGGEAAGCGECAELDPISMNEAEWDLLREYADKADDAENGFVAIRGFEWSASIPQTGHMNVWFSQTWTDPIATGHAGPAGGAAFIGDVVADDVRDFFDEQGVPGGELFGEAGHALAEDGAAVERANPANIAAMGGMYEWLTADPSRAVLGGGRDGLAGFNHPGREAGRFGQFALDPSVLDQVVSIEVFNRREDYLFEGTDLGQPSPIVQCLNAGWRVGLNGVTDEHGADEGDVGRWGLDRDKGRCGLWVATFDRNGIKEAMRNRRFFATNRRGFRLDVMAASAGQTAFMGGDLTLRGPVTFTLDVDGNDSASRSGAYGTGIDDYRGRTLNVQVCTQGDVLPTVVRHEEIVVPGPDDPPLAIRDVDLGPDTTYAFLRITDPTRAEDRRAALPVASQLSGVGAAIAYSSPFFISR